MLGVLLRVKKRPLQISIHLMVKTGNYVEIEPFKSSTTPYPKVFVPP